MQKQRPLGLDDAVETVATIETATEEILSALASDDLDAVEAALTRRHQALERVDHILSRLTGAREGLPNGPSPAERITGREIWDRLRSVERRAGDVAEAVSEAMSRAHGGLRTIEAGRRLAGHQADGARGRAGGWCDVKR